MYYGIIFCGLESASSNELSVSLCWQVYRPMIVGGGWGTMVMPACWVGQSLEMLLWAFKTISVWKEMRHGIWNKMLCAKSKSSSRAGFWKSACLTYVEGSWVAGDKDEAKELTVKKTDWILGEILVWEVLQGEEAQSHWGTLQSRALSMVLNCLGLEKPLEKPGS